MLRVLLGEEVANEDDAEAEGEAVDEAIETEGLFVFVLEEASPEFHDEAADEGSDDEVGYLAALVSDHALGSDEEAEPSGDATEE